MSRTRRKKKKKVADLCSYLIKCKLGECMISKRSIREECCGDEDNRYMRMSCFEEANFNKPPPKGVKGLTHAIDTIYAPAAIVESKLIKQSTVEAKLIAVVKRSDEPSTNVKKKDNHSKNNNSPVFFPRSLALFFSFSWLYSVSINNNKHQKKQTNKTNTHLFALARLVSRPACLLSACTSLLADVCALVFLLARINHLHLGAAARASLGCLSLWGTAALTWHTIEKKWSKC